MPLAPVKRYLDDIVRDLLEPILRPRTPAKGWKLLSWDAEQGLCLTIQRGGTVLLIELEDRDPGRDCYARTARFNVCARRQFDATTPLADADRRLVDAVVKLVRLREGRIPNVERTTTAQRTMVREIEVGRVLMPEGAGHYYLNPYSGCMIGCDFCYVAERADMSRRMEGLPKLPWGSWLDVKVNAAQVLREEVKRMPPGIVRMSPILTDPYQSVERHYRVTRQCLEVLLGAGFVPAILTRAARVLDDLPLLRRFPKATVGFSVPSDDDRYRSIFEPGGDSVEDRIDALRRCAEAGLHTTAVIQPVLPMNVDRLVELIAPIVRAVRIDRMYELHKVRHLYEANGLGWAMQDAFFDDHIGRLREGFRAHGVMVDEMDDLVRLLGLGQ